MEHLWSRAVATGGNRWQMERPRKWLRQANSVAVGCDRLPRPQNSKEGSTVRVRPRASSFCLLSRCFPLSLLTSAAEFGVHAASTSVHRGRCPSSPRQRRGLLGWLVDAYRVLGASSRGTREPSRRTARGTGRFRRGRRPGRSPTRCSGRDGPCRGCSASATSGRYRRSRGVRGGG